MVVLAGLLTAYRHPSQHRVEPLYGRLHIGSSLVACEFYDFPAFFHHRFAGPFVPVTLTLILKDASNICSLQEVRVRPTNKRVLDRSPSHPRWDSNIAPSVPSRCNAGTTGHGY